LPELWKTRKYGRDFKKLGKRNKIKLIVPLVLCCRLPWWIFATHGNRCTNILWYLLKNLSYSKTHRQLKQMLMLSYLNGNTVIDFKESSRAKNVLNFWKKSNCMLPLTLNDFMLHAPRSVCWNSWTLDSCLTSFP
jgi:hypothetical protein